MMTPIAEASHPDAADRHGVDDSHDIDDRHDSGAAAALQRSSSQYVPERNRLTYDCHTLTQRSISP